MTQGISINWHIFGNNKMYNLFISVFDFKSDKIIIIYVAPNRISKIRIVFKQVSQ